VVSETPHFAPCRSCLQHFFFPGLRLAPLPFLEGYCRSEHFSSLEGASFSTEQNVMLVATVLSPQFFPDPSLRRASSGRAPLFIRSLFSGSPADHCFVNGTGCRRAPRAHPPPPEFSPPRFYSCTRLIGSSPPRASPGFGLSPRVYFHLRALGRRAPIS